MAVEVINAVLKIVIGRRASTAARAAAARLDTVTACSCPSAHASGSFAAARVLSQAVPPAPVYAAALAMATSGPTWECTIPPTSCCGHGAGNGGGARWSHSRTELRP